MGIRADIETDLADTLEDPDDYGMAVELISPAGVEQTQSANDVTKLLYGQVLYDTTTEDPATGMMIVTDRPVITLRRSSLDALPARGWIVRYPESPIEGAAMVTRYIEQAPQGGRSIGFIRIYPGRLVQE